MNKRLGNVKSSVTFAPALANKFIENYWEIQIKNFEKKFKKDLDFKLKRDYLCHPQERGVLKNNVIKTGWKFSQKKVSKSFGN